MSTSSYLPHLPLAKPPSPPSSFPLRFLPLSTPSIRRHIPLPLAFSASGPIEPAVITNPALNRANIFCFQSGYNVQIVVDEGESEEALLRRFRREVSKAGVIQECKRRKFFENKHEEKKRKQREAGRRNRRRRLGPRFSPSASQADVDADAAKKARADDDDNWDLPEGDLPF